MTAIRNAVGAALVASFVALAGLTACSSSGSADSQPSSPALYQTWTKPLTDQLKSVDDACRQTMSTDCVNKVEALMTMLNNIRADVDRASASGKYTTLRAALDKVDADHQRFKDMNCESGNLNFSCNTMVGGAMTQDVSKVLNELGNSA